MMISKAHLRKVDIHLNQKLFSTSKKIIKRKHFTLHLRLSIKKLIDYFNKSPEELTHKLIDNLSEVKMIKRRYQVIKRITVGFNADDLSKLDELLEQLKNRKVKLCRQDLIRFSLLLWPNPR